MQSAEQPQRRRWLLIGVAAICLIVAIWAIVQGRGDETEDQSASSAAGIVRESDGVAIRLDNVDATQIQTELTFTVTLPDEAVESHVPDVLGPIFPGNQLKLDGIEPQSSGLNIQMKPHQAGETSLTMTLTLGPVIDPAQGATVTFANLPFALDEGGPVAVDGPWEFPLQPELFSAMKSTTSIAVGKSVASQGLTITVDQITSTDDGLLIDFTIASDRDGLTDRTTNNLQLHFEDGSTIAALQTNQLDGNGGHIEPGSTNTFIATFPPIEQPDQIATLSFGPFVASLPETASIDINDPFGDWSSEPLTVHGERLAVTQVDASDVTGELTAVIENIEPVEDATIMFSFPTGGRTTATDANGNEYLPISGATSVGRGKAGNTAPGEHGTTFTIDPTTPTLTIHSTQIAVFLDGPWEIDVQLP